MYHTTDSTCSIDATAPATAIRDAALVEPATGLAAVLQRYFGLSALRPLQEQIVADCLAGRDVLVLMPTGGGKSLCYQLPALVRPGLTVVVSPLIALMKDQVDFLRGRGIAAAVINSAQSPDQTRRVLEGLERGAYRLLYVAPERLMQLGFLQLMSRWNVSLLAIDEAHCISDWGHDFRPEYRQLREIRLRFPDIPLMALTATATDRVREDIVAQLGLRDPGIYVAGFNRPNLIYRVEPKRAPYQRLLTFLGERRGQGGIVYCFTRRATERLAERLSADGFKAVPYHAGLEQPVRARHQDMFLRDDVQVVCATIAFGMGVNKANIRFVVHYDLPKNIESYYQETGRAGRDGDPAECLMLFSQGDVISHERRIDEKTSAKERDIARKQLDSLLVFARSTGCRRHTLLAYFGDRPESANCGGCDNCLGETTPSHTAGQGTSPDHRAPAPAPVTAGPLEDRTEDARRFLACLDDIVSQSRFNVGITHVVDVLFGSVSAKVMRFGHEKLETYGSGKLNSKREWTHVGKELVRLGYLRQAQDGLPVLSITDSGRTLLAGQGSVAIPARVQYSSGEHDAALFDRLRRLRTRLAAEQGTPAFVIFTDAALQQMSRAYPTTPDAFRQISGVGQRKLSELGPAFMREIEEHLKSNARATFGQAEAPPPARKPLGDSEYDTLRRFRAGQTVADIAHERGVKETTVLGHLSAAADCGEELPLDPFVPLESQPEVAAAFEDLGWVNLTGVHERLGGRYDYAALRIYRAQRSGRVALA
ncbi:MAG: RecQ family ATP-dependent DNA helicase [Chloroflexota bacterium]|nr:RecQ family ATP-dependent DNA helicase [Chloroflexota bacterium]